MFSVPNEGKGPNDALGFGVGKILDEQVARGAKCAHYLAATDILRKHTQGKPIRGVYSVYQEYVFFTVDPSDVSNVDPGKTVPRITFRFHFRSMNSGQLEQRRLPCWREACIIGNHGNCQYTAWASAWDKAPKPGVNNKKDTCSQVSQETSFDSGSECFLKA